MFDLGAEVYIKTDPGQHKGVIISITIGWNGGIIYEVGFGTEAHDFQAIELSTTKDLGMIPVQEEED